MSNKFSSRRILVLLTFFFSVSFFAIACNNSGGEKTEPAKDTSTTMPVSDTSMQMHDTTKMDTQKTRPVVKPN